MLTPAEAKLRGRLGAYTRLAKSSDEQIRNMTAAGRRAFMARFDDEVDPERALPEAERFRRAEAAKKAYYTRLSMKRLAKKKQPKRA